MTEFGIYQVGKMFKKSLKSTNITVQKLLLLCQTTSSIDQVEAAIDEGIATNENEFTIMRDVMRQIMRKWTVEFSFPNNQRSADKDPENYDVCFREFAKRHQRGKLTHGVRAFLAGLNRAQQIFKFMYLDKAATKNELYEERSKALECIAESRPGCENLEEDIKWLEECQNTVDAFEFVLEITETARNKAANEYYTLNPQPSWSVWI